MSPRASVVMSVAAAILSRLKPACLPGGASARPLSLPSSRTGGSGVGALLHLAEHIVEVEAGGLLALRILPERLQVLPDKGLRRHQQEDVIDKPIVVGDRRDVGALEGIRAQVVQLWHAQGDEGLGPNFHRARLPLF